jgi:hypothetical protein
MPCLPCVVSPLQEYLSADNQLNPQLLFETGAPNKYGIHAPEDLVETCLPREMIAYRHPRSRWGRRRGACVRRVLCIKVGRELGCDLSWGGRYGASCVLLRPLATVSCFHRY